MIKTYPNAILRQKCEEVDEGDVFEFGELIRSMSKVITDFDALGLAAPQIGTAVRIIGIYPRHYRVDKNSVNEDDIRKAQEPKFMINPKIVETNSTWIGKEACLSFPGVLVDVKRNASVKVEYIDQEGQPHTEDLFGEEAIIVQHEIDHLDGITLINKASQVHRGRIMRKLKVARRRMKKYAKMNKRLEKIGAQLKKFDDAAVKPETVDES